MKEKCPIRVIPNSKNDDMRLCRIGSCTHPLLPDETACPCHSPAESQGEWQESFREMTEEYIRSLTWSERATDLEKTLVAGNIRGFAAKVVADIGDLPERTRAEERLRIRKIAEGMYRKPFLPGSFLEGRNEDIAGWNAALDALIKELGIPAGPESATLH